MPGISGGFDITWLWNNEIRNGDSEVKEQYKVYATSGAGFAADTYDRSHLPRSNTLTNKNPRRSTQTRFLGPMFYISINTPFSITIGSDRLEASAHKNGL